MNERQILNIINNSLDKNSFIGDDCAYLKELGIVVTQDTLVEDIHFMQKFASAYQIAYKSVMVNLSDVFASGAIPKYITISLSLPKYLDENFIKDFYKAVNDLANEYDFEVIGGDITGAEKIVMSICAIGITKNREISSRANAKPGDYVITTGVHGSSAAGLWLLQNNIEGFEKIKQVHLMPVARQISDITSPYAMMDTSDGLSDALFKISQASNVSINLDFKSVPIDDEIVEIANIANGANGKNNEKIDYKNWVLFGGEDFQLIACVNEKDLNNQHKIIGKVVEKQDYNVKVDFENKIEFINDLDKTFNHFK